ncbi:prepilin peptidase (plasmid) [Parasedimentitalea marina]|uniref:Prepilin leader peptidase/N-methyltransferase n=1 Tax=Parasedimentitalea marina TaxID=2483033 RepID=A0A3T0N9A0_9RHOB|nr:A24 family peptidase [Parasedimentitalea marina]AZV80606.1 prepilin peptidase [Parasedimentitalea marina]
MSTDLLFVLLLAPAIGSFLGVLVDRLTRGEDVIRRRSACRNCKTVLAPRDLIPIVSFALVRGHCRHCAAPIPAWLLYIEILATGAAVLAVAAGGTVATVLLSCLLLWLLIGLAVADLLWFRLPDGLTLALFLTVLIGAWQADTLTLTLWGALLGGGSFWGLRVGYRLLRGRQGLGFGDVKLMVGLGGFSGPYDLPLMVLLAALSGLGAALVLAWRGGDVRSLGQRALPFGTALCAAAAVLWLLRAAGVMVPVGRWV